ncbi:hypothetical protein C8J57DRAFT_1300492, partial [Mycena rebaudengoi]
MAFARDFILLPVPVFFNFLWIWITLSLNGLYTIRGRMYLWLIIPNSSPHGNRWRSSTILQRQLFSACDTPSVPILTVPWY